MISNISHKFAESSYIFSVNFKDHKILKQKLELLEQITQKFYKKQEVVLINPVDQENFKIYLREHVNYFSFYFEAMLLCGDDERTLNAFADSRLSDFEKEATDRLRTYKSYHTGKASQFNESWEIDRKVEAIAIIALHSMSSISKNTRRKTQVIRN